MAKMKMMEIMAKITDYDNDWDSTDYNTNKTTLMIIININN